MPLRIDATARARSGGNRCRHLRVLVSALAILSLSLSVGFQVEAQTPTLQRALTSEASGHLDGGMASGFAYCAFHAPTFQGLAFDAQSNGMTVASAGNGQLVVSGSVHFPSTIIQWQPLENETASCLSWSTDAQPADADSAVDDIASFYVSGGRLQKTGNSPSHFDVLDLPFKASVRAFSFNGGNGAIYEVSGMNASHAGLLGPPAVAQISAPQQARPLPTASDAARYDFEFLLGTGCAAWLPDLMSAIKAMDQSGLMMARYGNAYAFVSDFGLLQLYEGPPGQIQECMVMGSLPLADIDAITRRTLAISDMTYTEAALGDGLTRWTGTLRERIPGTTGPIPIVVETFYEPRQAESGVTIKLMAAQ